MRYHNGRVTEAFGYGWCRGDFNESAWPPGGVLVCSSDGLPMYTEDGMPQYVAVYKQLSVFSCGPFLPIVVINGDPLSAEPPLPAEPLPTDSLSLTPLMFHHPPLQRGISHAVHPESHMEDGPGPCKYVAGANPSWMPSLVPTTYSNPYNPGPSNGLAGELPIILGLMAFSESKDVEGALDRIFLGDGVHRGKWRDGQWHRTEAPRGCKFQPFRILCCCLFLWNPPPSPLSCFLWTCCLDIVIRVLIMIQMRVPRMMTREASSLRFCTTQRTQTTPTKSLSKPWNGTK